jgi:hypothetical protein
MVPAVGSRQQCGDLSDGIIDTGVGNFHWSSLAGVPVREGNRRAAVKIRTCQ